MKAHVQAVPWERVMCGHEFYKQIPGVDTYRQNSAVLGGSVQVQFWHKRKFYWFTATPCAALQTSWSIKLRIRIEIWAQLLMAPNQGYMRWMQKSRGALGSPVQSILKLHLEFTALFSPPFAKNKIFPLPPCNEIGSEWKAEQFSEFQTLQELKLCSSFCALEHEAASLYKRWG